MRVQGAIEILIGGRIYTFDATAMRQQQLVSEESLLSRTDPCRGNYPIYSSTALKFTLGTNPHIST